MKTGSQSIYHIACHVDKQGTRPPRESNQPGVEKCLTGSATSLEQNSDGNHAQGDLPAGSSRVTTIKKKEKRQKTKWRREDYKEMMYAFYMSLEKPAGSHTENKNYMRLERNIHRSKRPSTFGNWF